MKQKMNTKKQGESLPFVRWDQLKQQEKFASLKTVRQTKSHTADKSMTAQKISSVTPFGVSTSTNPAPQVMATQKDRHHLVWDLIRKHDNNKTAAAKQMGMCRQHFNYYVNQAKRLPEEFVKRVTKALGEHERATPGNEAKADMAHALARLQTHQDFIQLEPQTQGLFQKILTDILR